MKDNRSERTEAWQKTKALQREKFPVVGFVKGRTGVAALYLGKQGKDLVYLGKVGTMVAHRLPARSASNSIASSAQGNPRRHGLNRSSSPTLSIATPHRKGCCGRVRSRGFRGMMNPDCPVCFGSWGRDEKWQVLRIIQQKPDTKTRGPIPSRRRHHANRKRYRRQKNEVRFRLHRGLAKQVLHASLLSLIVYKSAYCRCFRRKRFSRQQETTPDIRTRVAN